jgi:hypothetical protein
MPQYLVLIYSDEKEWERAGPEISEMVLKEHRDFQERNRGAVIGGNALEPTSTATSLRKDTSGGFAITDGPFAETKEALGGYYLIEAVDLDEAMAVAKQVPAPFGGVEVRPVMVFN